MPAYVIVEISIHDNEAYEAYKKLTPATLTAFDGRFIVRGGKSETLEGEWNSERLVVLEFPNAEKAREWWISEQYAPAKKIRQASATTRMLLIEGI